MASLYVFSQTSLIAKVQIELETNNRKIQKQLRPKRGENQPQSSRRQDEPTTTKASISTLPEKPQHDDGEGMAACLLIKDDNHLLIEWMAYHYLTLPLRYLVVAVDPDSFSSPLPILQRWNNSEFGMQIMLWTDRDYMDQQHLAERLGQRIASLNNSSLKEEETVRLHRDRQKLFVSQCSLYHKNNGRTWVAHFDTDEYIVFNYVHSNDREVQNTPEVYNKDRDNLPPIGEKTVLQVMNEVGEGTKWKQDGCMDMVRILFGPQEERKPLAPVSGVDTQKLNTMRYFRHSQLSQENKYINGLQKVLLDVSKSKNDFLEQFFTIHRPSRKMCPKAYYLPEHYADSLLRVHHYLGSWEQYSARQDDRRHRDAFDKKANVANSFGPNKDIVSWLRKFVAKVGVQKAQYLLEGAGEFKINEATMHQSIGTPKCALVFFGVPRSFATSVFPSIKEFILDVNPACDIFVHSYNVSTVIGSRMGEQSSGALDINDLDVFESYPTSYYKLRLDTEDEFQRRRNLTYFRQFFPKPSAWEYPVSMDNMIRQWHSIEGGWKLLEKYEKKTASRYDRVGFFRLDVKYTHPIPINTEETAVIPAMMYPQEIPRGINDRLFYGAREAAALWASDRFNTVEDYLSWQKQRENQEKVHSKGLHSEEFLRYLLLDKWALNITIRNICFQRVRTTGKVLTKDCDIFMDARNGEVSGSMLAGALTVTPATQVLR